MNQRNPSAVTYATIGHPHRKTVLLFDIFVDSGLLRAELCANPNHARCLWKLDDLHEALILQLLRAEAAKHKALNHAAKLEGEHDRAEQSYSNYLKIKDALAKAGNVQPVG